MKFGASHMMRGRTSTEVFDLGTLVPELAEIEGGRAFQLLVLPGTGSRIAQLDPASLTYQPQSAARRRTISGASSRSTGTLMRTPSPCSTPTCCGR